jgi:ABC-type branched-subunit amino acid transport system substrate-binding protein
VTRRRFFFFAALPLFVLIILWWNRPAEIVKVGVLFDSGDTSEAVISRQALQSVILATEYFNSRTSSLKIQPVPIYEADPASAAKYASQGISALIAGPRLTFTAHLSQASKKEGIPVVSLAAGSLIRGKEDLVFRPRPETGGFVLGREAARRGVKNYSVIVSGFDSGYVQEFIRDFEAGLGTPPRRTMVFGGDLVKQIGHFGRIVRGMDAMLLALSDWPSIIAFRELRLMAPDIPVFASNRAISHRSAFLAGNLGKDFYTAAALPGEEFNGREGFYRFVTDTYGHHIPSCILAMGYDGVAMLNAALTRSKTHDRNSVARALSELESVNSSAGIAAVDRRGGIKLNHSVLTLAPEGWIPFEEPAPEAGL